LRLRFLSCSTVTFKPSKNSRRLMRDPLSATERSQRMAKVRSRENRSTERVVEATLRRAGIRDWCKHPQDVPGKPDFYFRQIKLAIFVDGCFWHGCPLCCRRLPKRRRIFWSRKLTGNLNRDARVRRKLRRLGYKTIRIWEHELRNDKWLRRVLRKL
jgi:DNA mismatch endonuclease (patch repair protein)